MATLNPPLIRGDYEEITFIVKEPDPANPGQRRVRNITSDTFRFTAKRKITESDALLTKSLGSGVSIVDGPAGKAKIEILPADTAGFTKDTDLICDVQGTPPGSPAKPYTTKFSIKVELDVST